VLIWFFGLVGVGLSTGGGSLPIAVDVDEDFGTFGGLPDLNNMDDVLPQQNPTLDPKGKGKEMVNPGTCTASTPVSILDDTRGQLGTLTQNALLGMKGITKYSGFPSSSSSTSALLHTAPPNDPVHPVYVETSTIATAGSPSHSARQQRKEDIIRRAKERRDKIQEELDVVKKRLWETTIERAGLLLIARRQGEGGKGVD